MTSANFHVCYASVANALFEHIEQDLLLLTTALIDDDEDVMFQPAPGVPTALMVPEEMPPPK